MAISMFPGASANRPLWGWLSGKLKSVPHRRWNCLRDLGGAGARPCHDAGGSFRFRFCRKLRAVRWRCDPGLGFEQGAFVPPRSPSPPAAPPPKLSFLAFMDLFTEAEQLAIAGVAMMEVSTKLWYDRAVGAQFIDLADERVAVGLTRLSRQMGACNGFSFAVFHSPRRRCWPSHRRKPER